MRGRRSPPRSESSRSSARTISPSRSITCLENAGGVRPGFCHTNRFPLASCVFPFDKTAVGIYTVVPKMAGRAVGAGWKRCVVRPRVSDPIRESSVDARDRLKSSCCEDMAQIHRAMREVYLIAFAHAVLALVGPFAGSWPLSLQFEKLLTVESAS